MEKEDNILLNDKDKILELKQCPHDNLKTHYMSYCLFKRRFVARICEECFEDIDQDLDIFEISKESYEMRKNLKR
jgi:hypothetical protein